MFDGILCISVNLEVTCYVICISGPCVLTCELCTVRWFYCRMSFLYKDEEMPGANNSSGRLSFFISRSPVIGTSILFANYIFFVALQPILGRGHFAFDVSRSFVISLIHPVRFL